MAYQANEIIILNNEELYMLLAAAGIDKWYGAAPLDDGGARDQISKADDTRAFNATLASLYQKGLVEWAGDKAMIAPAYKDMFRALRDAKLCILLKTGANPEYIHGYYIWYDRAVNVSGRVFSKGETELSWQYLDDWLEELRETGLIPKTSEKPGPGEEIYGAKDLACEFELRSMPRGELLQTLSIYEQGLYTIRELSAGGKILSDICLRGDAERIIKGWCKGEL